jgi:hypothetical protein
VQFVAPDDADSELILVLEGCQTACADLGLFDGKKIRLITQSNDAEEFIREILGCA